jgi:hypothetical protein
MCMLLQDYEFVLHRLLQVLRKLATVTSAQILVCTISSRTSVAEFEAPEPPVPQNLRAKGAV